MPNVFFMGDTHFGHNNILKFEPVFRPFASIEEMNEEIVKRWNAIVRPEDTVWHMGDVFFGSPKNLEYAKRLMGNKKLILGNHDVKHDIKEYLEAGFNGVYGMVKLGNRWLSHSPVHPDELKFGVESNVHGHTHSRLVTNKFGHPDPRYINVCAERTNCTPVALEDLDAHQARVLAAAKGE